MGWLVLLFTLLPIVEIWLLLTIGGAIGFWPTVGLTLLTAVVGGYLAKREGLRVLRQWRRAMGELRMPEEGLLAGALVLVGGVLLATPGVISDVLGLLLLFPPTRRLITPLVAGWAQKKIANAAKSGRLQVRVHTPFDVSDLSSRAEERRRRDVIDTEGETVEDSVPLLEAETKRR